MNTKKSNNTNDFVFPQIELISTLYTPSQLNAPDEVQVAFAGRSNVGKSSLLNALSNRKNLAKVSSTPGKTRSVNFFYIKKHNFYLVDLPGYGYAKRSKSERDVWAELISQYLEETEQLKLLLLLIDVRIPPQTLDKEMLAFATHIGLKVQPILTKCDKVKQTEIGKAMNFWRNLSNVNPIPVSANTKSGIKKLWDVLIAETETSAPLDDDFDNDISGISDEIGFEAPQKEKRERVSWVEAGFDSNDE